MGERRPTAGSRQRRATAPKPANTSITVAGSGAAITIGSLPGRRCQTLPFARDLTTCVEGSVQTQKASSESPFYLLRTLIGCFNTVLSDEIEARVQTCQVTSRFLHSNFWSRPAQHRDHLDWQADQLFRAMRGLGVEEQRVARAQ